MIRASARLAPIVAVAVATVLSVALPMTVAAEPAAARPARGVLAKRVTEAALAAQRGGTESTAGTTTLNGTVSGNQAINVTTGGNAIGGGAFAGASGVPVVIQNSGNNVLIQSSVVVNVQLK